MIPKIIHYCWFGGNPLSEVVQKCIESWKRFMPEYEIKRWDESNFNIDEFKFAKEAYAHKQYAFVADACRSFALSQVGGVYLDTDMFFIAPLPDKYLETKCFSGWENDWAINGGIIGAEKDSAFVKDLVEFYKTNDFVFTNGRVPANLIIPEVITGLLKRFNIRIDGSYQEVPDYITLYPKDYFYPKNYTTGLTEISFNTIAIHLYDASWHSKEKQEESLRARKIERLFKAINELKEDFTDGDIIGFFYLAMKLNPFGYIGAITGKLWKLTKKKFKK